MKVVVLVDGEHYPSVTRWATPRTASSASLCLRSPSPQKKEWGEPTLVQHPELEQ